MKRLMTLAALLCVAVSCQSDGEELTPNVDIDGDVEITVSAGVPSNYGSRMGVAPDEENEAWEVTWDEDDVVGGWSSAGSVSEFTIVDGGYDEESSQFEGTAVVGSMRLIYPYDASAIVDGAYTIDLTAQSVDFTTEGGVHDHYGDNNLYMVSESFEVSEDDTAIDAVGMSHLCSAIELEVTNSTGGELTLERAIISGFKGSATLSFGDLELTSPEVAEDITLSITASEALSSEAIFVPFSIIPTDLSTGDTIEITLYFTDDTEWSTTKTLSSELEFIAGEHSILVCEVDEAVPYLWSSYAATSFANGTYDYTSSSSYTIETAEQLAYLSSLVNKGTATSGKTFTLAKDIDLSAHEWVAIGTSSSCSFQGTFDGAGYEITGLYINQPESSYQGLFGCVYGSTSIKPIIKNVGVSGSVTAIKYVGGLAGYSAYYCTFTDCYNACDVSTSSSSTTYVGGLAGYSAYYCTFTDCYNACDVSASSSSTIYAGGLVGCGSYYCTFTDCYNIGDVSASGSLTVYAGGLVGYSVTATITDCYNAGEVLATNTATNYITYVGGLAGFINVINSVSTTISGCYNTGDVSASGSSTMYVGGVVSASHSATYSYPYVVTNCYNTGKVSVTNTATASNTYVGGVMSSIYTKTATNPSTITNCYNAGDVSANVSYSAYFGGVLGYNASDVNTSVANCYNTGDVSASCSTSRMSIDVGGVAGRLNCNITNCYNTGEVSAISDETYVGGVVGFNTCIITNCYYNSDVNDKGVSDNSDIDAKTDVEMKNSDFVTTLNDNAVTYNSENSTLPQACAWVEVSGGYPALDFDGEPVSSVE